MNLRKMVYEIVNKICKAVKPEHQYKNSKVNYSFDLQGERKKYKYLLHPLKKCEKCNGSGYMKLPGSVSENGQINFVPVSDICDCMTRHKKFQEKIIQEDENVGTSL